MSPERDPCPWCGEPVALEARLCPYCDRSALVDVRLQSPPAAGKPRYRLARTLAALGAGVRPVPRPPGEPWIAQRDSGRGGESWAGPSDPGTARVERRHGADGAGVAPRRIHSVPRTLAPLGGCRHGRGARRLGLVLAKPSPIESRPRTSSPRPVTAASSAPRALSTRELARRVLPSTVSVRCSNSVGAGFFADSELVLTNAHVLCGGGERPNVVLASGQQLPGDVVSADQGLDLALLRVTGAGVPPLPLGDAGDLAVGDKILVDREPLRPRVHAQRGHDQQPLSAHSRRQLPPGRRAGQPGKQWRPASRLRGASRRDRLAEAFQGGGHQFRAADQLRLRGERPFVSSPAGSSRRRLRGDAGEGQGNRSGGHARDRVPRRATGDRRGLRRPVSAAGGSGPPALALDAGPSGALIPAAGAAPRRSAR